MKCRRIKKLNIIEEVKTLTLLRFPTESYRKAYNDYEQYLRGRTIVFLTATNILFLMRTILGSEHFFIAERFSFVENSDAKGG